MNHVTPEVKLPAPLLNAISSTSGGRVSLVIGAGCSSEEPTNLPLSGDLAAECHRKLIYEGVLIDGEVEDKRDLSSIAEVVFQKTNSQRELVERFPQEAFRNAQANDGYLNMAALFLERALLNTLTLNFDFAARSALAMLGAGETISTVKGPEDYARLSTQNLIYLHRDIDSPPDEIILRTSVLDTAWREGWGQVITQRVLASPVIVFVGLGSPASVLFETMTRIVSAVDGQVFVVVVDPSSYEDSRFVDEIGIPEENYCKMGWGDFMVALARRVTAEQCDAIVRDCEELTKEMGIASEDVTDLCGRLSEIGLLGFGRLRSAWMLQSTSYMPCPKDGSLRLLSSLVLGVRMVESLTGRQAIFRDDGVVDFRSGDYATSAIVCSGGGWRTKSMVEARLDKRLDDSRLRGKTPLFALVAGVENGSDSATPSNLIVESDPYDVVTGSTGLHVLYISELRSDPSLVHQVIR